MTSQAAYSISNGREAGEVALLSLSSLSARYAIIPDQAVRRCIARSGPKRSHEHLNEIYTNASAL